MEVAFISDKEVELTDEEEAGKVVNFNIGEVYQGELNWISNIWMSGFSYTSLYLTLEEQIEVRKCLLSFGAESSVLQVAIQEFKDQDI